MTLDKKLEMPDRIPRPYHHLTDDRARGSRHRRDAVHALKPRPVRRTELAPPHIAFPSEGDSIVSAGLGMLIGAETIAAVHSQCLSWVKTRIRSF
jgi:hypothetical protein